MKIWVLLVEDADGNDCYLYKTYEGALNCVMGDIEDRNHFDTDEPYITREELAQKQQEARDEIEELGYWQDDDGTNYWIQEKELND